MRFKCFLVLAGLALVFGQAVCPDRLRGEFGAAGEPRAPGRTPTDLSARWKQLAGGATVWRRADVTDPHQRFVFDLVADRLQCANGEITRDQFLQMTLRPAAERPHGAAQPSTAAPAPRKAAERPIPKPATPSPAGRPADEDNPGSSPSAQAEFRRCDVNGDGLLSYDEMDEALRDEREKWDTNQDGFIDLAEFKAYFKARTRQEHAARGEAPRAVAVGRPGKPARSSVATDLPPNLPAWFRQYDSDGDGQIGLYEWRAAGRPVAQFEAMDFNGDGFLTPDEVLGPAAVAAGNKESKESSAPAKEPPNNDPGPPKNNSPRRILLQSLISGGGGGVQIRLGN